MDPFDPDAIIHVLSRCEACQMGQVGTRVCVEKGHHATVASVKRSARGSNFVDPYTEEEVDARYRLMLKPGEPLHIIKTNAVIDGAVKFAPGTVFQQPPNTKSQTLLGCFKNGVPLHDFVLGGNNSGAAAAAALAKKERELEMDDRQPKRRALSQGLNPGSAKKGPVAPMVTVKKPPTATTPTATATLSEKAAVQGLSGVTSQYFTRAELEELEAEEEGTGRPGKRQGTRSSSVAGQSHAGNGAVWDGTPAAAQGADSATQLELLSAAEGELRVAFDAHMKYLSEVEEAKRAEMAAFQRAGEAALQNMERSRKATTDDGLRLHKAFLNQRQRITRLRMEEVDQERARNQVESEKREARLKAEKEALSRACEQEAAELGNAWAVVEAAAGFAPEGGGSGGGDGGNNNGDKMQHLVAAAAGGGGGGGGAGPAGQNGVVGAAGAEAVNGSGEGGGQSPPGLLPGIAGEGNGTVGE
ncbi:hypothetical protein Esi_0017_0203 [Ectocarpus siliculosus]|uniref:Uncharacterized protein n=1 Tax=Ectocarpus siliculosus TaxID=2880 RepID=D7FMR0_ECTSI|nr:hypothetical protein Esi_0017_0203 [Ectocarpus siliculosus]|eukprot:CBJ25957.1 hypothetical protein Esi_0017_0203 [Ectocarpus siliculosus]